MAVLTITAAVTDAAGRTAEASVTVDVRTPPTAGNGPDGG